jgi:hypothetical protein
VPFVSLFIGYDGQHYLCCSDWKKEVPLGSVFDSSFVDVMVDKLVHVRTRQTVCRTCNLDPLNQLTEALRAHDAGEADAGEVEVLVDRIERKRVYAFGEIEALTGAPAPAFEPAAGREPRRTIPVTAL